MRNRECYNPGMSVHNQGSFQGRYTLVPRVLIFLTNGERILLLKGAPHKRLWANYYNGLGGHIERGEDVISAAQREIAEEAGINDVKLWLCGVITINTGQEAGVGVFVLRGEAGTAAPKRSAEGLPEWIPLSQLYSLPLVEDLHLLLPRVLAMQIGDPPFSAHYNAVPGERLTIRFKE